MMIYDAHFSSSFFLFLSMYIRIILSRKKILERKVCWLYGLEMDSDELLEIVYLFLF